MRKVSRFHGFQRHEHTHRRRPFAHTFCGGILKNTLKDRGCYEQMQTFSLVSAAECWGERCDFGTLFCYGVAVGSRHLLFRRSINRGWWMLPMTKPSFWTLIVARWPRASSAATTYCQLGLVCGGSDHPDPDHAAADNPTVNFNWHLNGPCSGLLCWTRMRTQPPTRYCSPRRCHRFCPLSWPTRTRARRNTYVQSATNCSILSSRSRRCWWARFCHHSWCAG